MAKSKNPWGKTLELIMDSATPGKPSVQNDMIGYCSGLVIDRREHDAPNLTLLMGNFSHGRKFSFTFWKSGFCNFVQNDCGWRGIIESMDSATPWKMTWGWGVILREKSSSFSLERGTSIAHWIYVYCNSGQALHAEWHLGEVTEWKKKPVQ